MKLAAADSEDLEILSARLQDATARLKDFVWLPRRRRFAALFNRYRWEDESSGGKGSRVRAGLHFDNVLAARSRNVRRGAPGAVVSLLAIRFTPNGGEDPGGTVELLLAGGGSVVLTVEAIEASLTDLTAPWPARGRPLHDDGHDDAESA